MFMVFGVFPFKIIREIEILWDDCSIKNASVRWRASEVGVGIGGANVGISRFYSKSL